VPQISIYVSDEVADRLRAEARRAGISLSKYVTKKLSADADGGPANYFDRVIGSWKGELERPEQLPDQQREPWYNE
jgi:hypothetical protein